MGLTEDNVVATLGTEVGEAANTPTKAGGIADVKRYREIVDTA